MGMFGNRADTVRSASRSRGGSDRQSATKPAAYYRFRAVDEALGGALSAAGFTATFVAHEYWLANGRFKVSDDMGISLREMNNLKLKNETRRVNSDGEQVAAPGREPSADFESMVRDEHKRLSTLLEGGVEAVMDRECEWTLVHYDSTDEEHQKRRKNNSGSDIVVTIVENEMDEAAAQESLDFIEANLISIDEYKYVAPTKTV